MSVDDDSRGFLVSLIGNDSRTADIFDSGYDDVRSADDIEDVGMTTLATSDGEFINPMERLDIKLIFIILYATVFTFCFVGTLLRTIAVTHRNK